MLSHTFTDIVTGLFIFATLMNALLCLVFKGRKQTICINSLLITATATAISLSVMWLQPAERSRIKVTKDQPVTFKADSLQSYLIFADVIQWVSEEFSGSKFVPPANECNRGRRQILGYAEDKLKGMLPSYPDNEDLVIRFCLVSAEIGNDPCEQIKHYTSPKNRDETLGIFTRIFCREETSSAESKKFQTAIEKTLPLGWYRRSALMTVYALLDDKPSYQRLLHERKDIAKRRLFGMLAAYAYFLVVLLVGFIVVCRFLWQFARGRGAADKLESHLSIRTVYGIWLMTLY